MSIDEALRALEKKWRSESVGHDNEENRATFDLVKLHCADELAAILTTRQEVAPVADAELPGMWAASDFTGGDPDERSYSERNSAVAVGEVIVYDSYRGATLYDAENCTLPAGTKLYTTTGQTSDARDALQEILRVHANDNHRPQAFYIAAKALAAMQEAGK